MNIAVPIRGGSRIIWERYGLAYQRLSDFHSWAKGDPPPSALRCRDCTVLAAQSRTMQPKAAQQSRSRLPMRVSIPFRGDHRSSKMSKGVVEVCRTRQILGSLEDPPWEGRSMSHAGKPTSPDLAELIGGEAEASFHNARLGKVVATSWSKVKGQSHMHAHTATFLANESMGHPWASWTPLQCFDPNFDHLWV